MPDARAIPLDTVSSALGAPETLLIEITSRCNLTCKMCPLTSSQTPSSHDPGHIDEATWRATFPLAVETGRVNLGGYGEPLSNPRCLDYLRELDAAGVHTVLTTNGHMVNRKVADQLAALRYLDGVNVSIDSPNPEIYKTIRGGNVAKALEGLAHMRAALREEQVTVSSVMMASTIESLVGFPAMLAGMGVRHYVLQGLVDYTPGLDAETLDWRRDLPRHADRMREAAAKAGVHLSFALPEPMEAQMAQGPIDVVQLATEAVGAAHEVPTREAAKQCHLPWVAPVVDKDGRLFPCCYALSHASAVLGNVRDGGAQAMWLGPGFTKFRRDIVDGRTTPDICKICTVASTGPHLFGQYAAEVLLDESSLEDVTDMRVRVKNTGASPWTRAEQLHIGTANPRDHASAFHHPSWIGGNRITGLVEDIVPPGGVGTFRFQMTWQPEPAFETFQLVIENKLWMPETRFRLAPLRPAAGLSAAVRRFLSKASHRDTEKSQRHS